MMLPTMVVFVSLTFQGGVNEIQAMVIFVILTL
jgi:hypothetical protein